MKKLRIWITVILVLIGLFAAASVSYAYAAYHGNWSTQPTWGNHWWYNNSPTNTQITWYADDLWEGYSVSTMQWWKMRYGINYHLEQEAYNPGTSSNCDRLRVTSYSTLGLPVDSWVLGNGCGSSSWKEELKIGLDELSMTTGTWYRHKVVYNKSWTGCNGSNGEVNYSFSHSSAWNDSWMGKITYNSCFDKTGSDPAGMVN